ncbi:MAG: YIP1 family protein [Rhodobacteraceae bacterium]|nr:YIP1 family protein [Paracoccaceae bacterium]
MTPASFADLLRMVVQSTREPRIVLRRVLGFSLSISELLQIAFLISVVTVLIQVGLESSIPDDEFVSVVTLFGGPVGFFGIQFGSIMIMAGVMTVAGRVFGGSGQFIDCMKTTVWLNFILLVLQVAQLVAAFIVPLLALMVVLFSLVFSLVLIIAFVMEVHGFRNVGLVILATAGTVFATFLIASFLLVLLGFGPQLEALTNV